MVILNKKVVAVGCNLVLYIGAASLFILSLLFSVFYLSSGYNTLKSWFFSLNNCFYHCQKWPTAFFTQKVKYQGNYFAFCALVLSFAGLLYFYYSWKKNKPLKQPSIENLHNSIHRSVLSYLAILIISYAFWHIGKSTVAASSDEVFSALNCAGIHPFQTLAYYMLPNNHIYFNFLNGILSHFIKDPVRSGRIFSGLAYTAVLYCAFSWFIKRLHNHLWSLVAILPIALQFISWGFSFQSRGYELDLLCGWVSFITLFQYQSGKDKVILRTNTLFGVLGFIIIPSFLYYYFAQLVFLGLLSIYRRSIDFSFWKYQLFLTITVFLCYLPGICFSGIQAFTENRYVSRPGDSLATFLPSFFDVMKYYINVCFSALFGYNNPVNFILFLLPLILLLLPQYEKKLLGFFYIILWVSFCLLLLYMKRPPFTRNINLQYSITMACVVYTLFSVSDFILNIITNKINKKITLVVVFCFPVVLYSAYLYKDDLKIVNFDLYGNDINQNYSLFGKNITAIPTNSSIAFSDESFYWRYYCGKMNYYISNCRNGHEDYYINEYPDQLPSEIIMKYTLIKTCGDFQIYKYKYK